MSAMQIPDADPRSARAEQIEYWEANAPGRDKWWEKFEGAFQVVSDRLVELAGIKSGDRVLDVGTGVGEPAFSAASVVGPRGSVVATDISPAMLSFASKRARQLGLADVLRFEVMDAEELRFAPRSFDAVVCRFVLMFLGNPHGALSAIRGVLRPGAKLALSVLGPAHRTPLATIWHRALEEERGFSEAAHRVPVSPAAAGVSPSPFRFGQPQALEDLLEDAGFTGVEVESVTTRHSFASAREFMAYQLDMNPGVKKEVSVTGMGRVFETLERLLAPFTDCCGAVALTSEQNLAVAAAPN